MNLTLPRPCAWAILTLALGPLAGQSPHTAALIVEVVDGQGKTIQDAAIAVKNTATGAERQAASGHDGRAAFTALPLTGAYTVSVSKPGFGDDQRAGIVLLASETAVVKVKLVPGAQRAEVTVFGTAEGVRADAQLGRRMDAQAVDQTPILGRKVTSLPLFNAAFRQAKGTGDLFVNATYFVTGVGGRRQTTVTLDGANNDEGWGRQTMIATIPVGAIQEFTALSNAFSSEFGWTSGPALNIVTKSGTNAWHGEAVYLNRPGAMQAKSFSTKNFCPPSVATCVTPSTLQGINPVNIPDFLSQASGSLGGAIQKDRTFFFLTGDYTLQNRTARLADTLPAFLLPRDGRLDIEGHYRQRLVNARLDHRLTERQSLMLRFNFDGFFDDNPQDAVGGTNAPSVARRYSRRSATGQINHTATLSPGLLNEARFAFLNGDPVTKWEAGTLSTTYTRAGAVPFTIGQSRLSDLYGRQAQFSDTLSWTRGIHYLRIGGNLVRHVSGGFGSEPGTAVLGTFTFRNTTTAPFDQLTLADVQQYTQPINFGVSTYRLAQWLVTGFVQDSLRLRPDFTLDLGLRYDHQSLTGATKNFAPRLGFGWHPGGHARLAIRGGYGLYYTQIRSNLAGAYLISGLDGLTTYTATPGQSGFPTCLTGACLPLSFDPRTLPASQLPARDITIQAGQRDFYTAQFARYGLDFSKVPNYPDALRNPRSQVLSIGTEMELGRGIFIGADYVRQHLSGIERTVDLNAPTPFDRTAPGQARSVAAANLTRAILPVNGGIRQVNVLTNLGVADYHGLQTQFSVRGHRKFFANVSYTLAKATNTTEPDGNGFGPNESHLSRLGEIERAPSLLDQRHRAVVTASYQLPLRFTVGTVSLFATARPFNATTGVDNNGDGVNNDRPVVNGAILGRSTFRGTPTQEVGLFVENRVRTSEHTSLLLRLEGFNLLNHGNYLARGQSLYGDTAAASPTFGQFVAVGTSATAIPAFANIDPPRMFQLQVRFVF